MSTKLILFATIIAVSSILTGADEAKAQGYCNQNYGNFGQSAFRYGYPTNRVSAYSSSAFGGQAYAPSVGYPMGYGNYGGYGYPSQSLYLGGYGYQGGNRYMGGYGNYGYPSRSGIGIGIGPSGFGNRGYGGYRGFGF